MSNIQPPTRMADYALSDRRLFLESPRTNWPGVLVAVLLGIALAGGAIALDAYGYGLTFRAPIAVAAQ